MKVITRHGASKPTEENLLSYQEGYDTRENQYGKHEGKELFINDNGTIRSVAENYLKEEFVNYVLPTDAEGNIIKDGSTVYSRDAEATGVLAHLQKSEADVFDENDTKMATQVSLGAYMIDTKNHIFSMPDDNQIKFFSVEPTYLAKLKNSLEQKAVYVVDSKSALEDKLKELAAAQELEPGVQIIVKHDESQDDSAADDAAAKNDTVLYVVTTPESTDDETEVLGKGEVKLYSLDDGSYKVASEDGRFTVTQLITLEYLFHDPVGDKFKGLGTEVTNVNDVENKATVRLTDTTVNVIEEAYNHGYTINDEQFGVTEAPESADGDSFKVDGATYANYVPYVQFEYNQNDPENPTKTTHYIDFSGFVLDEGTWDN